MTTKTTSLKQIIYQDFYTDFRNHPVTGDLVLLQNEDSVIQSIENLLLTGQYERYYNNNLAGNISAQLFENNSIIAQSSLQDAVSLCIKNYEPRAELISVVVNYIEDSDAFSVTVTIAVQNLTQPVSFTTILQRIR